MALVAMAAIASLKRLANALKDVFSNTAVNLTTSLAASPTDWRTIRRLTGSYPRRQAFAQASGPWGFSMHAGGNAEAAELN
jgi:hypothetical protein